jgi:hypothetical protein
MTLVHIFAEIIKSHLYALKNMSEIVLNRNAVSYNPWAYCLLIHRLLNNLRTFFCIYSYIAFLQYTQDT